jgi:hypothetical protein
MPYPSEDLFPTSGLYPTLDPDNAVAYDYEAPNGVPTAYRARAVTLFVAGDDLTAAASEWAYTETPVAWISEAFWLKHPTRPSMNMTIGLASPATDGVDRGGRDGKHQPLGSTEAVVISDEREAATGTIQFRCDTDEERDALFVLADQRVPLLFQCRADDHEPDRWLVLGDHTSERILDKAWFEGTWQTFQWTAVSAPIGKLAE